MDNAESEGLDIVSGFLASLRRDVVHQRWPDRGRGGGAVPHLTLVVSSPVPARRLGRWPDLASEQPDVGAQGRQLDQVGPLGPEGVWGSARRPRPGNGRLPDSVTRLLR
jgi:hypothetical protein